MDADISEGTEEGHRVLERHPQALGYRPGVFQGLAEALHGVERAIGRLGQHVCRTSSVTSPHAKLPQRGRHDPGGQRGVGAGGPGQVQDRPGHTLDLVWLKACPPQLGHQVGDLDRRKRRRRTQLAGLVVQRLQRRTGGTGHGGRGPDGVIKRGKLPGSEAERGCDGGPNGRHPGTKIHHRRADFANVFVDVVERLKQFAGIGPDLDEYLTAADLAHVATSCQLGPRSFVISSGVACLGFGLGANGFSFAGLTLGACLGLLMFAAWARRLAVCHQSISSRLFRATRSHRRVQSPGWTPRIPAAS